MARKNSCHFYANRDCECYPCHKNADSENFNCLFCYCPLYALGEDCGGNFSYTEQGFKDCSNCLIPHSEKGYDYIIQNYPKIAELARRGGKEREEGQ